MSGLAFVASRRGAPAGQATVAKMATAAPHRGSGPVVPAGQGGAAAAALGSGARTADDRFGRLIVADTRLDELPALARSLGYAAGELDEAALILEAYARWGEDCASRLAGDFAFVIWDAPRAKVMAARDMFGMRPLFYMVTPERILAASEIAQIIELPDVPRRVDERTVLASLVGPAQSPRWTHFEGVRRLRPGHVLRVDARGARSRAFWRPPTRPATPASSGQEYVEQLRQLHTVAVRDRLTGTDTPGLMLSGGIDSMSIAATAASLRAADASIAALTTYSFAYDRFHECDERSMSDQVIALTGQSNIEVPVDDAYPLADHATRPPDLDGPDLLQSHVSMRRTATTASAAGVSLLMTGQRGDALFAEGAHDYLGVLRTRGPFELWRQATQQAQREEISGRRVLTRDLARRLPAAVWPRHRWTGARDRLRQAIPGGVHRPPWVRPEAIAAHAIEGDAPDAVPASRLAGEARRRRHEAIVRPNHAASTEYLERLFARAGVRYADPWSDRRIADWVLSVPPARITSGGQDKWVLREAMRGLLPEPARDGSFRAEPGPFYRYGLLQGAEATVRTLLSRPLTAERGFVDATALSEAYQRYQTGYWPGLTEWSSFWRWLGWERWLRAHDP